MQPVQTTHHFEEQYAYNQDIDFRINARRNKLVAAWAVQKLGLAHEEAQKYVSALILLNFEQHAEEKLKNKLLRDFEEKKLAISLGTLVEVLQQSMAKAQAEIAPVKEHFTSVRSYMPAK